MGKTPPKEEEVEGSPRNKAPRVDDAALSTVPVESTPSPTGKTPPKGEEAEGSPRKKDAREDDAALIPVPVESAPSSTGKTPPKGEEAEGSPRKKAAREDDAALIPVPVELAPSSTGKTPPKGEEAEGSPRKKAPRLDDAARATVPGASEPNPTGEAPPKEEAKGSPPKRSRSPRKKSPSQQDKRSAALPQRTVPEFSELIVRREGRASDEKLCKCNHIITDSAIKELIRLLKTKDAWTCNGCSREDEKGIIKVRRVTGDLLICVTCYDHLCCGVGSDAYPFGHSRAHALKNEHWFAVLCCDLERGYCFKCNAEVPMPVKFGEGDNEIGVQQICSIVSRKLLAPPPSVGQIEAVNPEKVDLADKWSSYESRSSDAQGYAIRGIPNKGNTCYMSALLQCLFVLGKLREKMLVLDHPNGKLPLLLKKLFVETSAAGDLLNVRDVLSHVGKCKSPHFKVGSMEDSHELLTVLRDIWNQEEEIGNRQDDARTVIDSIFGFEMLQKLSCKKCGYSSPTSAFFLDLPLTFPSKWHPTKSAASQQTSETLRSRKRETAVQIFPADVQRNLEKMQTVSESGYSHVVGSEVDSTQAQRISQSKDVVQSPLQIQKGKSVDSVSEDSISIEDLLLLFSEQEEDQVVWPCPVCAKASQSKNREQKVGSGSEDDVGDTAMTLGFLTLPPVLTFHLNRTSHPEGTPKDDKTAGIKISGHVRFMEYLDVERFVDPSLVSKGSTLYRLAGVVEHIGEETLNSGHYIAYVRARRLGNQQEGSSCSSSWFCADDHKTRQVTLDEVLNREAYILFYERMEDQDISAMPELTEDIPSCWEMIKSSEIVNCMPDPQDPCIVYKLKAEDIPWGTKLIYNKYNQAFVNVLENNKDHIERIQRGAEWMGQFSPVVDHMLSIPVCKLATITASHIGQGRKTAAFMGRAYELLRHVIPPPEDYTILLVANKMQAIDAVTRWNKSGRSKRYFVLFNGVGKHQAQEVKMVMNELHAANILYLLELYDSE